MSTRALHPGRALGREINGGSGLSLRPWPNPVGPTPRTHCGTISKSPDRIVRIGRADPCRISLAPGDINMQAHPPRTGDNTVNSAASVALHVSRSVRRWVPAAVAAVAGPPDADLQLPRIGRIPGCARATLGGRKSGPRDHGPGGVNGHRRGVDQSRKGDDVASEEQRQYPVAQYSHSARSARDLHEVNGVGCEPTQKAAEAHAFEIGNPLPATKRCDLTERPELVGPGWTADLDGDEVAG
jgi:hypothetical protein